MDSLGPRGIKPGQRFNRKEKSELELLGYDFTDYTLLTDICSMWVCISYTRPESRLSREWGVDEWMDRPR